MNNSRQITIIGGGLAGSMLAARLLCRGFLVTLIDEKVETSASRVAAGLFNVITGRSMVLTWKAKELLASLNNFFSEPSLSHLSRFLHPMPIYFPFKTASLCNDWSSLPADAPELEFATVFHQPRMETAVQNQFGGIEIHQCGWMETGMICEGIAQLLQQSPNGKFISGKVNYSSVEPRKGKLLVNGESLHFDELVFCEGVSALENPFFEGLPLRPLKGQLLEIEIENFEPGFITTSGIFLLPVGGNRFYAGSTYEPVYSHPDPDALGRAEIEFMLKGVFKLPYKVTGHRAGIRPSTPDRRPILGRHPKHNNVHIINGLGAKGALHSPWCAERLEEIICKNASEIEPESSLLRYMNKLRNLID